MNLVRKVLSWLLLVAGFAAIFLGIRLGMAMMHGEQEQGYLATEMADVIYDCFSEPQRATINRELEGKSMPAVEYNGFNAIGYLTFPSQATAFAVQASYESYEKVPRYVSGAASNGTLRISNVDVQQLAVGDVVVFTDVFGRQYVYAVEGISTQREEEAKADLILLANDNTQAICMEAINP